MDIDLGRFIKVHRLDYERALREIKNGKKLTHWMWYIFPQIKGLGMSEISKYYSINSLEEARAYLENEMLGNHLLEISKALLMISNDDIVDIMGEVDALKLQSSMTLFSYVSDYEIFDLVLDKYYGGVRDINTIKICRSLSVN